MGLRDYFSRTGLGGTSEPVIEPSPVTPAMKAEKRYRIPLCKTTSQVKNILGAAVFPCPSCESINSVPITDIDPILGTETMCLDCQNMLHIPGGYRTKTDLPNIAVTAAIPVAISKFPIFYTNHPIIRNLKSEGITNIIIQYGMWGFCQKCHHAFSPAVLINLPTIGEEVDTRAMSIDEMAEMKTMRMGHCPYCSHRILLVIISDVPPYVISASQNLAHRWDED